MKSFVTFFISASLLVKRMKNLKIQLAVQSNPYHVSVRSNFSLKLNHWYKYDKNNFEGDIIEKISKFRLYQKTNNPIHVLDNYSSFLATIFASQPNLVVLKGVHQSLHPNCCHEIVF